MITFEGLVLYIPHESTRLGSPITQGWQLNRGSRLDYCYPLSELVKQSDIR